VINAESEHGRACVETVYGHARSALLEGRPNVGRQMLGRFYLGKVLQADKPFNLEIVVHRNRKVLQFRLTNKLFVFNADLA
jgi:hypothetical protein